jgi:hypothetical protein
MNVFYGGAIQGAQNRKIRASVNKAIIDKIKQLGYHVVTEHTTSTSHAEAMIELEKAIGPLPEDEMLRRQYVREKMINAVEGDIVACVFEVSIPSLGTGIEFAHAYLRPRLGLKKIPVLALYQKEYWPNKLSTMIRGISKDSIPHITIYDYETVDDAKQYLESFFTVIKK